MKYCIFALLLLASSMSYSNVCEVKSGEVKLSGAETSFTAGDGGWIEDCSGTIELVSEEAEICLFNQLKQWHCKVQQKQDGTVDVDELTIDPEYATGFFGALRSLFNPDTEMAYGGLRLKDDEPLPGFPYSDILLPTASLDLNIERATGETITTFRLVDTATSQEIFVNNNPGASIAIPAAFFSAGKEYQWTMMSPEKTFTGTFAVVEAADQLEFEADLNDALAAGDLTGPAQELMRAVVAREYGYTFDYQQSLDKTRQSIKSADTGGAP
jgi:hypothetical protein